MKILTTVFILFFTVSAVSQRDQATVDANVLAFTKKLEARNINTYFTTQRYCEGDTQMFIMGDGSRCFSKGTYAASYIVWMEDNKTMIKKIDNCGMFASSEVTNSDVYNYFKTNGDALQNNKVKPYAIANAQGGPISRTEINNCHRKFQFTLKGVTGSQAYKPYDLTNDSREANINYNYNKKLEVVTLDTMLDKVIKTFEADPNSKRI